jgi:rare lipoprotein A
MRLPILLAMLALVLSLFCASAETTLASWYDEDLWNADGSRFNPDGLTAAHRTLPFGTRLQIRNLATGRSVVVVIRDRGPAAWTGRGLDLSRGAAHTLGMIAAGVARVVYSII